MCQTWIGIWKNYLYRDACNYKQRNRIVIPGTFRIKQVETIMGCLSEEEYFIPDQVGFPEMGFGKITEDNRCWFELEKDAFMVTSEEPDVDMTPDEAVARLLVVKDNWNDSRFLEKRGKRSVKPEKDTDVWEE